MITSSVALKEWSVVVEALACGRQLLIVRKGGIREEEGNFSFQHREFLLYPTTEHQKKEWIRPEFLPLWDDTPAPEAGSVLFQIYAGIAYTQLVRTANALEGLERYHIWTPDFFTSRMRYRPESPAVVALLRVYRLKSSLRHPVFPEYAGCKSWVPLKEAVSLEGAHPVVDNRRFRAALQEVSDRLG